MQSKTRFWTTCFAVISTSFWMGVPFHAHAQRNTPVPSGLIARYAFDNSLADSSATRNDLSGFPNYNVDRRGNAAGSVDLLGNTQLTAGFSLSLARDFSTSCWIRPRILPEAGKLHAIFSVEGGTTLYFNLGLSGDSGVGFRFEAGGNGQPFVNYRYDTSFAGVWSHVAVVRNDNRLHLYVNGIARDSAAVSSALVDGLSNPFNVGGSTLVAFFGLGGYYNGLLDDLRIYNRPLTKAEVDTLAEHLPTGLRPHLAENEKTQVWPVGDFQARNPHALLLTSTGTQVSASSATPGLYLWLQGRARKRIVLQ